MNEAAVVVTSGRPVWAWFLLGGVLVVAFVARAMATSKKSDDKVEQPRTRPVQQDQSTYSERHPMVKCINGHPCSHFATTCRICGEPLADRVEE